MYFLSEPGNENDYPNAFILLVRPSCVFIEPDSERKKMTDGGRIPLQGYLAHKKQRPPRTLPYDHAEGPTVALGGGVLSYDRGTPVWARGARFARRPMPRIVLLLYYSQA